MNGRGWVKRKDNEATVVFRIYRYGEKAFHHFDNKEETNTLFLHR